MAENKMLSPHLWGEEVAMTEESFRRNNMSQYCKARPLMRPSAVPFKWRGSPVRG